MSKRLQSIRGMHDILPDQTPHWQYLEQVLVQSAEAFGYQQIRMPAVEMTELFARSIGAVTDIVEKEMYTFDDRNGDSLTLRPEGTAGCVRAALEHGLIHNQQRKLYYLGPMFRHERPQKGRYRQFHQFGVEAFGSADPALDVEQIAMGARLWQALGIKNVRLEINTLGNPDARAAHRAVLVEYLLAHQDQLDEQARSRIHTNPLRVLDSKDPQTAAIAANAPSLQDYLDEASKADFAEVQTLLDALGIRYTVNPQLVRGLDYYNKTVFEWITEDLGAQGTICAGGRYDGLVSQLGGRETPAAGFAIGLERLISLLNRAEQPDVADVYIIIPDASRKAAALQIADSLRRTLPNKRVMCNLGGGGMKAQFKRADKSGALIGVIVESEQGTELTVKPLREQGEQTQVTRDGLVDLVSQWLNN